MKKTCKEGVLEVSYLVSLIVFMFSNRSTLAIATIYILIEQRRCNNVREWWVVDEVFLEQGMHTLNILKRFQSIEGSSGLRLYFFRFTHGQCDDVSLSR